MLFRTLNILALSILVFSGANSHAANLLLRRHSTHTRSVVYLGDVADISADTDAEMHDLATTPLLAAPAAGSRQFLPAMQLRDLLASRGIDVSSLSISGAKTIEIGTTVETKKLVAVEPISVPTNKECKQAATDAIKKYLETATGHSDWQVELELKDFELTKLAKLGTNFVASAGRTPWTGSQRFQLTADGSSSPFPVLARVDRLRLVVVSIRRIEQGNLIGTGDVEVRTLGGNIPAAAFHSLDQVVGKEALRAMDTDTVLQSALVRAPLQVRRGETVKVVARTGGITVSTFATVQQDGAFGDLVQVQTIDRKGRFSARVSGWKELEVLATGATTGDFAARTQSTTGIR